MNILHRPLLKWGIFIGGLLLLWAGAGPVLAHAVLVSANPEPNSIVYAPPPEIRIIFSEPVEPGFSQIQVFTQTGERIDNNDVVAANDDNTELVVTVQRITEQGTYLVNWRVLSAIDGHTTSGAFPFGVGVDELSPAVGSISSAAQQPTVWSSGGRGLTLTGVILLLGVFVFRFLVWQPLLTSTDMAELAWQLDFDFSRYSLKVGAVALILLGLGVVFTFVSQASQYNLFDLEFSRIWLGTRFGSMWFVRAIFTINGFIFLADLFRAWRSKKMAGWEWWAGLALAIGLTVTVSLVSHSAALTTSDALLALAVDLIHLLAAGVWVGGLVQLSLALWMVVRFQAQSSCRLMWGLILNFSTIAALAVGILLLSGGYLAWRHIGSWLLLFETAYGLVMVAKIGLAMPAFGLAALNLLVVKPHLRQAVQNANSDASSGWHSRLRWLAWAEALFTLLVLVAAGYLTDLQRGLDSPRLSEPAGQMVLEQTVDDLNVILNLAPAQIGQNTFDLHLQSADGQPLEDADEVSLRFTFLGQSMGTAAVAVPHIGGGRYRLEGGYVSLAGPWQVEAAIRRPNTFDTFAPFRLEADSDGVIRPAITNSFLERAATFLDQSGGSITGVLLILAAGAWALVASRAARIRWQVGLLILPGLMALGLGGSQLYMFYREYTPAKFTRNPILADSGSIARGQQLYDTHCATCHGSTGGGDGPLSTSFFPPPAAFPVSRLTRHPDGDVYYWIKNGVPGSPMPAFDNKLSDDDLWDLVNYVRQLGTQ